MNHNVTMHFYYYVYALPVLLKNIFFSIRVRTFHAITSLQFLDECPQIKNYIIHFFRMVLNNNDASIFFLFFTNCMRIYCHRSELYSFIFPIYILSCKQKAHTIHFTYIMLKILNFL